MTLAFRTGVRAVGTLDKRRQTVDSFSLVAGFGSVFHQKKTVD
jgi:hypothetical protein